MLDRHIQQEAQSKKIVGTGEAKAAFPFVNGLGCVKAQCSLNVAHGQSSLLPQLLDARAGCSNINDGVVHNSEDREIGVIGIENVAVKAAGHPIAVGEGSYGAGNKLVIAGA